jgi:hypothetical protein
MSMVTPLMRTTRPFGSVEAAAVPVHQRISATGAHHPKIFLLGRLPFRHTLNQFTQQLDIIQMNKRCYILGADKEIVAIHAENTVLALVPAPFTGGKIAIPRSHLTRGERKTPALLALQKPRVRGFEFLGALGDTALKHKVQLLKLARLSVHLGAQHLRE